MFRDLQAVGRPSALYIRARHIDVPLPSLVSIPKDLALLQLGDILASVHTCGRGISNGWFTKQAVAH
jgi:hypothetical protein